MSENNLKVINFEAANIPLPTQYIEVRDDKFVPYGSDNLYPNYLLKLYNESPIHSALLNGKANFILGDGLKIGNKEVNIKANAVDSFNDVIQKSVKDYLIFNYFCIEVVYNKFNQPIEYHSIPAHKIRTNKSKTKFWFDEDYRYKRKTILFDRWVKESPDSKSKIYFFDGYFPSINSIYPLPEYNGSIKSIQTDIEIRDFNLNNVQNHFSVSTLITFFRGSNIAEEIRQQILDDLKISFSGSKGRKLMVDFQDDGKSSADVKNISPNDWDKAYSLLSKSVEDDIMIGHQITSPLLFGVKTEGQLGGSTELEVAFEVFNNTYVRSKRTELEGAFNLLFSNSELVKGQLKFADRQLFSARISEILKEKVYTINELRKEAGLEPMVDGDRLISEIPRISESIQPDGSTPPPNPIQLSKFSKTELSEEDFEKIKDFGIIYDDFEFVEEGEFITSKEDFKKAELRFENDQEIADYIIENKLNDLTVKDLKTAIRKDLGINVTLDELQSTLKSLNKSGVLDVKVKDGKVNINPAKVDEPKRKVEVMYSYEVREGLGEPIIKATRPFCKKLVENNRLYTREEIQTMSSIFGYDIYSFGGGFYRNPESGEVTSYCRHQFKSRTVVRKN